MKDKTVNEHMEMYGVTAQSELQLLETVLGKKAKAKVDQLLKTYDLDPDGNNYSAANILKIASLPKEELLLRGLTECEAERLVAAVELGLRVALSQRPRNLTKVGGPEELAAYISPLVRNMDHEVFGVIILNSKNQIISNKIVSSGSLTSSVVHGREIFLAAITAKAAAIAIFHNHPSGDPLPSNEDKIVTRSIIEAGKVMLIPVLDHIIIGGNNFYSFAEHGYFNN